MELTFGKVHGLPEEEQMKLDNLKKIYNNHRSNNRLKRRYYNGKVSLREVNLGIALPNSMSRLEIGCAWGAKTVDVLASRSMFDGFVDSNGAGSEFLDDIVDRNRMIDAYNKATREELIYGSVYAAVSGAANNSQIRFYSPQTAAAAWDSHDNRIDYGFVFEDGRLDESDRSWSPKHITFHTDTHIWQIDKTDGRWEAVGSQHGFGRPMMEAMCWDATSDKPFGQSRIKGPIRRLIQGYVRTIANATIGLEFATSPQKYMLGVTDEQYDALVNEKFSAYVGSIIAGTYNTETGEKPTFGQLQQGSLQPHVEMLRMLATQFSAASGLSVTDTGVVNDANPTSSDAILAQTQTLVAMAEQLNRSNGDALRTIIRMAIAVELGLGSMEDIPCDMNGIVPHFKNPSMPNVAVTADAAIKIASARENFGQTDVFLEMIGFDQADIRRIKSQERRIVGRSVLIGEFADAGKA